MASDRTSDWTQGAAKYAAVFTLGGISALALAWSLFGRQMVPTRVEVNPASPITMAAVPPPAASPQILPAAAPIPAPAASSVHSMPTPMASAAPPMQPSAAPPSPEAVLPAAENLSTPTAPPQPVQESPPPAVVSQPVAPAVVPTPQPPASPPAAPTGVIRTININTATAAELELLPGIGPAMAARILEHRQKIGGFKSVEQLDDVRGIGEKTMAKLRPLIRVQ